MWVYVKYVLQNINLFTELTGVCVCAGAQAHMAVPGVHCLGVNVRMWLAE